MRKRMAIGALALAVASVSVSADTPRGGYFQPLERNAVLEFWAKPGRYASSLPPRAAQDGVFQVRLTADGSKWLWNYANALGRGKTATTWVPAPQAADVQAWDAWVAAKIAFDRQTAARDAATQNARVFVEPVPMLEEPGPTPEPLRAALGDPPSFANVVRPMVHTVDFGDGVVIVLQDNPAMRPNYAYYRWPQGVMSGGTPVRAMPADELAALFAEAGVSEQAQKVMKAVSLLEGGFDAVNTYDTGFVSVGFIQFACLSSGGGSLGAVLLRHKQNDPSSFDADFRRLGVDVSPDGLLVAVNLQTGQETIGPEAARQIIDDKRLIAVFQRAGRISKTFRVAQLQVAKERYYPSEDVLSVPSPNGPIVGRVAEFVKTDAGLAALMDRKVHTGKLDPLPGVLAKIASGGSVKQMADFAQWEFDIVASVMHRRDYLSDPTLTQPVAPPQRLNASAGSRKSSRKGKRG